MIRAAEAQGVETAPDPAAPPPSLVDLINGLIEPVAPPPVSLIPQTWGWVGLALVLGFLATWAVLRRRAHRHANAYRRAALYRLSGGPVPAAELASTLRRAALAAYPRTAVAGLSGADWLAFLAQSGGGDFSGATGAELLAAPYRDGQASASPALMAAAKAWLKSHGPLPQAPAARSAVQERHA
jgi:hypothetical protein